MIRRTPCGCRTPSRTKYSTTSELGLSQPWQRFGQVNASLHERQVNLACRQQCGTFSRALGHDLPELDPAASRQLLLQFHGVLRWHGDAQRGDVDELPVDPRDEQQQSVLARNKAGSRCSPQGRRSAARTRLASCAEPATPAAARINPACRAIRAEPVRPTPRRVESPAGFPVAASGEQRRSTYA